MCVVAYFIDAFLLCVWNHKIIRPFFLCTPIVWSARQLETDIGRHSGQKQGRIPHTTDQTASIVFDSRSAKTKYSTTEPNIRTGTFAQSDLFADVTCHLEMFSLFIQTFEARLAMRKFKPCDATWSKSFEGAKLQVGLCIKSLADCCVCKSLWNCYAAVESLKKR